MTGRTQADDGPIALRTGRTVTALILREMSTSYGRTPGGYVWAVVEPVAAITVMTLIFTYGFRMRSPGVGTSFALFFATGNLPFQMFNATQNVVSGALRFSRQLLAYPGVTYLDAILARFFLIVLTKLTVSYIVFVAILLLFDTGAVLNYPAILNSFAMVSVLGLGIGCLNGYLRPIYPLWDTAWGIATAPLMLMSCVLFTFDSLPDTAKTYLWFNPLVHVIGEMRHGFYPNYTAPYVSSAYVYFVGMFCAAIGLMLLRRHHRVITNI